MWLGGPRQSTLRPGQLIRSRPGWIASFDHLVGAGEQRRGHFEAERFRRLEVDHEFVLCRVLHRQVGRLLALEDATDVSCSAAVLFDFISSVGDQAAIGDELADGVDRRQPVLGRERNDQFATTKRRRAGRDDQAAVRSTSLAKIIWPHIRRHFRIISALVALLILTPVLVAYYNSRVTSAAAQVHVSRANDYFNTHDYDRAIAQYNDAIRLDPNNDEVFNRRGNVYFATK